VQLLPLQTGILEQGCDLGSVIGDAVKKVNIHLTESDILIVSSKVVSLSEGRVFPLANLSPSKEAKRLAVKLKDRSPEFCEAVLRETRHRNGRLLGTCKGAALTEVNGILIANAGLDCSNAPPGCAIGWPEDPPHSAERLRKALEQELYRVRIRCRVRTKPQPEPVVAVLIIDSCCTPRRRGLTAVALACSGLNPFLDERGDLDLFGKKLHYTTDAVADCLASAASMLMGNGAQGIPAVLVRDHGLQLSDFTGWVEEVPLEEDLFRDILK
jgi:coenzyme F420-0:L-glutamate ligase